MKNKNKDKDKDENKNQNPIEEPNLQQETLIEVVDGPNSNETSPFDGAWPSTALLNTDNEPRLPKEKRRKENKDDKRPFTEKTLKSCVYARFRTQAGPRILRSLQGPPTRMQ